MSHKVTPRQKRPQSIHNTDSTTPVHGLDDCVEDCVGCGEGCDGVPGCAVGDAAEGDEELTVFVLLGDDLELPFSFEGDGLGSLLGDEGDLGCGAESVGFGTDVDHYSTVGVGDGGAGDDVVAGEGGSVGGEEGGELLVS